MMELVQLNLETLSDDLYFKAKDGLENLYYIIYVDENFFYYRDLRTNRIDKIYLKQFKNQYYICDNKGNCFLMTKYTREKFLEACLI